MIYICLTFKSSFIYSTYFILTSFSLHCFTYLILLLFSFYMPFRNHGFGLNSFLTVFLMSFYWIVSQEILDPFFHGLQTSASPPFFSASFAFCTSLFPFYSRITCTMSQSAAHLSMLQTGSPSVRGLFI